MTKLGRGIGAACWGALATALALLATAGPAAAETLLVQPDGKIVVASGTHPAYGALARLQPDGSLDPSFGQGGFVIDQRTVNFSALALQPDGRIVGGAGPGSVISRYLPDGAPDPGFAGGGLGGTNEPGQSYSQGPSAALLVQPGGGLVAAGNRDLGAFDYEAWVRRYDAGGALLETAGRVPLQGEAISSTGLTDLLERPDGSLIGAGWISGSESSPYGSRYFLVRFRPGSGSDFDPSFGGGAGLVRPEFSGGPASLNALAMDGDKLLVAGGIAGTFLLARFDEDGNLDPSFGEGGFVAPPIVGSEDDAPEGAVETGSAAGDVAVMPDGDVVLGGRTARWSTWTYIKMLGWRCNSCPQPLLARFDENGKLDPAFGSGGILRLLKPDGSVLLGSAGQVTPLADGKILVHGYVGRKPFVARLNPDGSYDPGFGEGGLTIVDVPCSGISQEELRPEGCVPSALVTLRLRGLRRGKPALSLRISPNLSWAAIGHIALALPHGVRPTRKLKSRLQVTGVGGSPGRGRVKVLRPEKKRDKTTLLLSDGEARELRVNLRGGSLRTFGRHRLHRRVLRLRMLVSFTDTTFRDESDRYQTLVRRVRSTG